MIRRIVSYLTTCCLTAVVAILVTVSPAFAAQPEDPEMDKIEVLIENITNWIMGLLFGLATLFLTIGGVRRMAADGDPGELEKARNAFRSALIGYALVLLSPALLQIVGSWLPK